jgi:hypothetical protein
MYRNRRGRVLSGNTQIVFIELSKLDKVLLKPVKKMTALEKWALFLRYANHADKQDLIHEILNGEEGVKMGAAVLNTLSKSEEERIACYYRLKAENDRTSQLLYARDEGIAEGMVKGMVKGMEKGMEKGMAKGMEKGMAKGMEKGMEKGMAKGKIEAAINMIKRYKIGVTEAMEVLKLPEGDRGNLVEELIRGGVAYED